MRSKRTILLLENDPTDVFFFQRALSSLAFNGHLHVAQSISQARQYFEASATDDDREDYAVPDLVVSDLRLTGESGLEFLDWLRLHPRFARVPFVLWSGVAQEAERMAALHLGVKACFQKTGDFSEFCKCVEKMLRFIPARRRGK